MRAGIGYRGAALAGLFTFEVLALALMYQFTAQIECQLTQDMPLCRGLRSLVARAMGVGAVAILLLWLRPAFRRTALAVWAVPRVSLWPIVIHIAGVILLLLPLVLAGGQDMSPQFARLMPFWALGAGLATWGGLWWLAPWGRWAQIWQGAGRLVGFALLTGFVLPDLADLILPLWDQGNGLTEATLYGVALVLTAVGQVPFVDAPNYLVGLSDFTVHIAQQCSGVEGLALVAVFSAIYAALMWDRLHLWRYGLVVVPLALLASWLLNVVRIAGLIAIGQWISPALAVDGFHSYAGWFFFILLALGIMACVQNLSWLQKEGALRPASPLRHYPVAARILPFIAFMLISILVSALFLHPEMGYPLKALVLLAVVAYVRPALRAEPWGLALWPVVAGLVVGVLWVLLAPPPSLEDQYFQVWLLSAPMWFLLGWIALRLLGTVFLVPLVEELFFRAYLLPRVAGTPLGAWGGILLSSLAFGLLHGRLWAGMAAGLVFALVYWHRKRLSDAVWAHGAANAVVAAVAVARGHWGLI